MKPFMIFFAILAISTPVLALDLCSDIMAAKQRVINNDFMVGRGLNEYKAYLTPRFSTSLNSLNQDGVWIDGGAGNAVAMIQYHLNIQDEAKRARTVAIGYAPLRESYYRDLMQTLPPSNFQYLQGRYFEDIPLSEFPKANLITDLYGIASYAAHLDVVLDRYFKLLKKDGELFMWISEHLILNEDGDGSTIQSYFESFKGVEVTHPKTNQWIFRKTSDEAIVPKLDLLEIRPGAPPVRKYDYL